MAYRSEATLSFGRARHGVLGVAGAEDAAARWPYAVVQLAQPVAQLGCGECHSIALATDGRTYTWGSALMGALGHAGRRNEDTPRLLAGLGPATQIGAAKHQTAIVGADGVVWFFGWDGCATSTAQRTPARLPHTHGGGGRAAAVGGGHIVALTASDGVICYGGGALFAGLLSGEDVVAVAAGAFHTAALTASGAVFTWPHPRPATPAGLGPTPRAGAACPPAHCPPTLPPPPPLPPPLPPRPIICRWLHGAECLVCAGDFTAASRTLAGGGSLVRWEKQLTAGGVAGGGVAGVGVAKNGAAAAREAGGGAAGGGAFGGNEAAAGLAVAPLGMAATGTSTLCAPSLDHLRSEFTISGRVTSLVGGGGYLFALVGGSGEGGGSRASGDDGRGETMGMGGSLFCFDGGPEPTASGFGGLPAAVAPRLAPRGQWLEFGPGGGRESWQGGGGGGERGRRSGGEGNGGSVGVGWGGGGRGDGASRGVEGRSDCTRVVCAAVGEFHVLVHVVGSGTIRSNVTAGASNCIRRRSNSGEPGPYSLELQSNSLELQSNSLGLRPNPAARMPESPGAPLAAATRPANASRPAATTAILPTRPFSAATFSTAGLASNASPARGASMAICGDKGATSSICGDNGANPPVLDDDGAVVSICGGNGAIPSVCAGNGAVPPLGDKGATLSACGADGASPAICGNKGASPPHCGGIRAFSPTRGDEGACWSACGDIGASPSICDDKGATPSICSAYPAATATCVKQTACSISGCAIDDAMGANSHSGKAACLQVRAQLDPPLPLEIGSPGWEVSLRLEGLSFSVASTNRTPSADAPASHPPPAPSPSRTPASPSSPAVSPPPSAAAQHAPGTPTSLPCQARDAWLSSHTPFTAAAPPPLPPQEGISSARNVWREPDWRESAEREWPCLPKPPAAPASLSRHGTPLHLAPSLSRHGSPLAPAHASRRTSPAAVGDSSATYETAQDSSPPYPFLDAAPSYPHPFVEATPPYPFSDGTGSPRGPLLQSPRWPARQGADPGEGWSQVPHPAARGDELSASVELMRDFLFVERQAQWRATAGAPAGLQGLCAGGGGGTRGALVGEGGTGGGFAGEAAGEGGAAAATQAAGGLRFSDWPPLPSPRNSLCWPGVRCSVTSPPTAPQAVAPAPLSPPAATVQLPPAGKNRHGDRNWPIDRNSLSGPNRPADKVGYADQNRRADPNRPADQNRPSEQQSRPQDPNKPADENGPADQNSPGPGAGSRRVRGGVARPAWVDLRPTASSVTDRWLRPEARRRESSASAGRDRTSPARDAISPSRTCISFGRDRISLGRHGISPSRDSRPAERDTTRIPPPPRTKARQMKPGPTDPGETTPGQTRPGQTKPVQTKPAETRPGETKPGLVPSPAAAGSARRGSSLVAPSWAAPSIPTPALGRGASLRPHLVGCANPVAQPAAQTRGQATSTSAAGDSVSPGQSPRGGARCGGSSQRARGGAAAGAPAATEHSATTKAKDVFKRAGGA